MIKNNGFSFFSSLKKLRRNKKLHAVVEERIKNFLSKILPELHIIQEVQGLAGGRNDLICFEFNGKKIVFVFFCLSPFLK
ncbi:MAG: hypothetical protein JSV88_10660 [Candidatus Aminicenantes bacterium]|nr:MAG: hypothetical protein JSV88_10660 [Candidatus Aminicenantes bacterium]